MRLQGSFLLVILFLPILDALLAVHNSLWLFLSPYLFGLVLSDTPLAQVVPPLFLALWSVQWIEGSALQLLLFLSLFFLVKSCQKYFPWARWAVVLLAAGLFSLASGKSSFEAATISLAVGFTLVSYLASRTLLIKRRNIIQRV